MDEAALQRLFEDAFAALAVTATDVPVLRRVFLGALDGLDDRLVSLEDGRRYRSLRRHLAARGLTPEAYRAKWKLPKDAPMVCPSYSTRRAEIARDIGLGKIGSDVLAAKRRGRDTSRLCIEITAKFG